MKALSGDFPIAVHPGDILVEMLEENELNQSELARRLKMDPSKINEICKRRRGVSAEMAAMLGKVFRISPSIWLNLQKNWELSQVDDSRLKDIEPIRKRA